MLEHNQISVPSSGGRWDGAKLTVRLSFTPNSSVASMRAVLVERPLGFTVADLLVNRVACLSLQGLLFPGRFVFGVVPPLRFRLSFPKL